MRLDGQSIAIRAHHYGVADHQHREDLENELKSTWEEDHVGHEL